MEASIGESTISFLSSSATSCQCSFDLHCLTTEIHDQRIKYDDLTHHSNQPMQQVEKDIKDLSEVSNTDTKELTFEAIDIPVDNVSSTQPNSRKHEGDSSLSILRLFLP